jgi:hypothetical protein
MRLWLSLAVVLWPAILSAQVPPATPNDEDPALVVEGLSKTKHINLSQFRAAQLSFAKFRGALAPNATLRFKLARADKSGFSETGLDGVILAFVSRENRIPIPVNATHHLSLPDLNSVNGDYRMMANFGKRKIFIVPEIYSPGTSQTERRLGDLRLTCLTFWGFYKSEIPIIFRAGFSIMGGCNSKKIAFNERLQRTIASATVTDGGIAKLLPLNPKLPSSYRWPLGDKSLSSDAHISIKFK